MPWNMVCLSLGRSIYFLTNEADTLVAYLSAFIYVIPVESVFQGTASSFFFFFFK